MLSEGGVVPPHSMDAYAIRESVLLELFLNKLQHEVDEFVHAGREFFFNRGVPRVSPD